MVAASPPTPAPDPTRTPVTIETPASPTPEPTPAQPGPSTSQPGIDTSLILWGDLFGQFTDDERNCLRAGLGEDFLGEVSSQPISPEEPDWAPTLFECLDPDRAMAIPGAMLVSLMVNEVLLGPAGEDEIPPETRGCVQALLADMQIGEVLAAVLDDPVNPLEPNPEIMKLAAGIQNCAPESIGVVGQTDSPYPGPNNDAILWQKRLFDVDFGEISLLLNAPTISEGVVYVGADDTRIHALDAATGDEIWSFETGDIVRSNVVVTDGVVYAGSNDTHLYALDARDGDLIWQRDTGAPVQYPPLVADGMVYAPAYSDGGRRVHALDAATGAQVWASSEDYPFDTGWETGFGGASNGDLLFSIGYDGDVRALDTSTGETVWAGALSVGADTPPVVIDDVVYVTAVNTAYALSAQSGDTLWEYGTDRYPARGFAPVIDDGVYYFAPDNYLYALDTATGEPLWTLELDAMASSSPIVGDGMVFIASESGVLYAIGEETGDVSWTVGPFEDFGTLQSLDVADGILYLESSDGYLLALDVVTGEILWGLNKGFFSNVRTYTIADGVVYISDLGGVIYAIEASSAASR